MKRKKRSGVVGLLILMGCAVILAIGVSMIFQRFGENKGRQEAQLDNNIREADILYGRIHAMSPEENYPQTPEGVMRFFALTYQFMYGPLMPDIETLADVLTLQRLLYGDELLRLNNFEMQLIRMQSALKELSDRKVYNTGMVINSSEYTDESQCVIRCVQTLHNADDIVLDFYLERSPEDNLWRIHSWEAVDD